MDNPFYNELQRDFINIRSLHSVGGYNRKRFDNTIKRIKSARDSLVNERTGKNNRFLLYCIDTLFEIIAEGNREKIFDFADTIHNMPEIYLNLRNEISFLPEIENFRRKYGDFYFKDILEDLSFRKIDIRKIKSISNGVLCYENKNGKSTSISLEKCAENYSAVRSTAKGEYKSVGTRLFLFSFPYAFYEIYADESIYFILPLKTNKVKKLLSKTFGFNFHSRDFKIFYGFQKQLNSAGYTTLDLG